MGSIAKRNSTTWRARYRDANGQQHTKDFRRRVDGQNWLNEITTSVVSGTYVAPDKTKITMKQYADKWLIAYDGKNRAPGTVSQAKVHLAQIIPTFGTMRLNTILPSDVEVWMAELQAEGYAKSTIGAFYRRLNQIMRAAIRDRILAWNPCSSDIAPPSGGPREFLVTTEQVWNLYDSMPDELAPAILLGAFAGLRIGEVCGLRPQDIDVMLSTVTPAFQFRGAKLKTEGSGALIPVAPELSEVLFGAVAAGDGTTILRDEWGHPAAPWTIQRHLKDAKATVPGLPDDFRFHDLRHYFASLLIDGDMNIKVVQARMRHSNGSITLNTYAKQWKHDVDPARSVVSAVFAARNP
jgi:integrase